MSIYRPGDIRGDAEQDLSPQLYRSWGNALGTQLEAGDKFIVGGDVRASTTPFLSALVEGLCATGLDVVDLGVLPSPMIYYAKRRLGAAGCAIVTGSHGSSKANGLRWMIGDRLPSPKDVRSLKQSAEKGGAVASDRATSVPRSLDVSFDYVGWLQQVWAETPAVPGPVILDPMHGSWSCRARRYLQAVFPRSFFTAIHDTPSSSFGHHPPDCSRPELLEDLSRAIEHHGAYLGIAFDGDGDRVAFVDEEGAVLTAEEATWVLLQSYGEEALGESAETGAATGLVGQRFVYDVKFSDRLAEAARGLSAEPLWANSSRASIHRRMQEANAVFGAEVRGHYFFRELAACDDAMYAAARVIAYLGRTRRNLSELRRAFPDVFVTPDIRVPLKARAHAGVLQRVREIWSQYPQTEVDGVRVQLPSGWALVRSLPAELALVFRFEAADWAALTELVFRFSQALPEVADSLWLGFHEAMDLTGEPG